MVRRLAAALTLLGLTAAVLRWVAPSPGIALTAMRHPQEWIGMHGAESAILTVAVAASWLLLGWLTLGLAVGLVGELPGAAGRAARALASVVLPRAIRQAVALTLGVGLVTATASAAAADPGSTGSGSPASSTSVAVDWPVQPPSAPSSPVLPPPAHGGPSGSDDPPDGVVLVRPGDSLWAIAGVRLGSGATPAQIAAAVSAWYQVNLAVIGPDPDLIHPGQRLAVPAASPPTT